AEAAVVGQSGDLHVREAQLGGDRDGVARVVRQVDRGGVPVAAGHRRQVDLGGLGGQQLAGDSVRRGVVPVHETAAPLDRSEVGLGVGQALQQHLAQGI